MSPQVWVAIIVGGGSLFLNLVAMAIGYGMLKGTVSGLEARVKALEAEVSALTALSALVARIDERTSAMQTQMTQLSGWLGPPSARRRSTS